MAARCVFALCAAVLACAGCNERPREYYTLLEVVKLTGTCSEDHVGQADSYAGEVVRWKADSTGAIRTYGYVSETSGIGDGVLFSINNPTKYQTPDMVTFDEI